ncbi:O-methyltransferase [Egibacter rhizosphaerae]|uniref:O-methyltransferase n=1 Tax=Egibacter rhizosphaerae TaxID=1670831 RepID=A0A411YEE2_9ACTN|nr:O-methyltransferase [Egibacter rhizosphaerae]QBI19492.1 O-methyltransferase [Egibacter rhizosphaerae]
MTTKTVGLSDELQGYLLDHSSSPDALLRDLIEETREHYADRTNLQIAPEQGGLLTLLTRLAGARTAVEVGTFTGYSAICIARGLAPGGRLTCCDNSEEYTAVARRYWQRAGLDDVIDLRLGDAHETVSRLPHDPPVDLAFVDADKGGYHAYYEELLARLSPHGMIIVDNVLWSGRVLDSEPSGDTATLVDFNARVAADERVEVLMLPVGDGLSLITRAG